MDGSQQSSAEAENITDIQNYLDTFNKEIQDGTSSTGSSDTTQQVSQTENVNTAAYYIAQPANSSDVEGYDPYANQNQGQFQGTTYYASSDGTYYASTESQEQLYDMHNSTNKERRIDFQGTKDDSSSHVAKYNEEQMVTTLTNDHNNLQRIVLAVNKINNVSGPQEVSVTIPTSMAPHSTEELLHAMERQHRGAKNGTESEETTFVAMQPGSGHDAHVGDGQAMTLITHGDESKDDKSAVRHNQPHAIHMVVKQPDGTEMEQTLPITGSGGSTLVTADGQEIHVSEEGTLQMMANLAENAISASADGSNQMILNTGASYQTVTIVPSDTNPGEVSYVLIVSQPDQVKDEKDINLDMSVYDFNEGEKHAELLTGEMTVDVTKMHSMKATPKKSQQATQAHMCNYCNYTSPKRYLLSRHMKSHSEERPHKCSVCERGFKTLASLQNHVNTHTGTRPHRCKECPSAFTTSGELVRHVRYKHTHEKPHRCTECDYASVELSKLKRHMRCHTGERPYQCPHCTYASPDTYKLKRHLRIHTGEKPYQCDICHAKFTQSNSLKAHKLIHSGNKPVFQCELCPTTCGRKTDLRIHVQKLHNSDKPMKCKRCSKTFSDRYSYKLHVKTHEGEKCFRCDLCSYASISQRHLESHMLIHTDQKPYRCDECDQSFRQKQLLRRHKNLYHTPNYIPPVPKEKTHECSECGKNFRHKGNLIRHMAIHDPDATAAERAAALRIGEPKGPGEQPDGEEDYGEEEYTNCISTNGTMQVTEDGQQVVVFEVIQLPVSSSNGSEENILRALPEGTMTMSSGNNDQQGVTIIQQVQAPSGSLAEEVAAAIAQVHGEEGEDITELISPLKQEREYEQPRQSDNSSLSTSKRGRGRPRKFSTPSESNESILLPNNRDGEREEQIETTLLVMETRQGRKKRAAETGEEAETIVTIPPKKGQVPKASRRGFNNSEGEAEEMLLSVCDDPEEMARKEKEVVQKKLQQKQKDMAECFGFNEDEEEDETILSMSAVPGMTVTQNHVALGPTCVTITNNNAANKDADFDHNTQLYTSLQNGSA